MAAFNSACIELQRAQNEAAEISQILNSSLAKEKGLDEKIGSSTKEIDRLKVDFAAKKSQYGCLQSNQTTVKEQKNLLEETRSALRTEIQLKEQKICGNRAMYQASIDKSDKLWQTYLGTYNQFPLVAERNEVKINLKRLQITLKQKNQEIIEIQKKIAQRNEIRALESEILKKRLKELHHQQSLWAKEHAEKVECLEMKQEELRAATERHGTLSAALKSVAKKNAEPSLPASHGSQLTATARTSQPSLSIPQLTLPSFSEMENMGTTSSQTSVPFQTLSVGTDGNTVCPEKSLSQPLRNSSDGVQAIRAQMAKSFHSQKIGPDGKSILASRSLTVHSSSLTQLITNHVDKKQHSVVSSQDTLIQNLRSDHSPSALADSGSQQAAQSNVAASELNTVKMTWNSSKPVSGGLETTSPATTLSETYRGPPTPSLAGGQQFYSGDPLVDKNCPVQRSLDSDTSASSRNPVLSDPEVRREDINPGQAPKRKKIVMTPVPSFLKPWKNQEGVSSQQRLQSQVAVGWESGQQDAFRSQDSFNVGTAEVHANVSEERTVNHSETGVGTTAVDISEVNPNPQNNIDSLISEESEIGLESDPQRAGDQYTTMPNCDYDADMFAYDCQSPPSFEVVPSPAQSLSSIHSLTTLTSPPRKTAPTESGTSPKSTNTGARAGFSFMFGPTSKSVGTSNLFGAPIGDKPESAGAAEKSGQFYGMFQQNSSSTYKLF